ncbi:MAG: stage II sporulation protein P, partial [Acetatifactor sp.]|nr:stage II sporulation protein P [Acetatifactor sp.]
IAEPETGEIWNPTALAEDSEFVPHVRQQTVDLVAMQDYETLRNQFYVVDSVTNIGRELLDVDKLSQRDLTIDKEGEGPQILIYHTHSQEGFADSIPGDDSTTIMGVGQRLADILEQQYGYKVLHHLGTYDKEGRDNAYSRSLPEITRLLEENPQIQVVIDLHRDAVADESNHLVMDLDGRPTARFMFFNGISWTRRTGSISYLQNDNLSDNLAFSFQMKLKAEEYYPGLTRKNYIHGYRYNMHLRPRTLLIELGAQNNTLEEAMNACDPIAHLLDLVLSGEE